MAEVGNPTVVATLTVVAALLPMLFVSGLMGPYMAPIPVNASAAMVFSFFVAVVIAPWLMVRFARKTLRPAATHEHHEGRLGRLYRRVAARVIATRKSAWTFLIAVGVATLVACAHVRHQDRDGEAAAVRQQVGAAGGARTCRREPAWRPPSARCADAARSPRRLPEVTSVDAYAGTAAPFNFNGLVRHYYLRNQPEMGDLHDRAGAEGQAPPRQPRHRARPAPAAGQARRCPRAR